MTQLDLEAIEARCEVAHREIYLLCLSRGKKWTMSIPIRKDDTDIVLADSFRDIPTLVAEIERLQRELHDERVRRDEWEKMYNQAVAGTEIERLRAGLEAVLDEATSDLNRDIIITECRSTLAKAGKETR